MEKKATNTTNKMMLMMMTITTEMTTTLLKTMMVTTTTTITIMIMTTTTIDDDNDDHGVADDQNDCKYAKSVVLHSLISSYIIIRATVMTTVFTKNLTFYNFLEISHETPSQVVLLSS